MAKANLGELLIKIGVDTKKLDAGLTDAGNSLKRFGVSSRAISAGVTAAFAGMTLAVAAFGKATTEVGAGFEQSMATVGAVAGSTEAQLGLMETRAREVGRSTLFTARQSADAMVEFARAGFKAGEIISATEPAINLAGATAANLTSAVKGVAAALKVFQLDAGEAARVADVFAVATQNSLFDLQGLIDAMKYGGPAAAAFGLSIEQGTAYMMVLRNLGLEASQAGVYLRQILTSAANLTPKAAKIFSAVGISAEELDPTINHLDDIIRRLGDTTELSGKKIQSAFGTRGGPIVAALVKQYRTLGEEGLHFLKFQEQLAESAGEAEKMYIRQIDTVIGQFTIAKSAMEDLFIAMFFGFNLELKDLGTAFAELFNAIRIELSSSGFSDFGEPINDFAAILRNNKEGIAKAFVGFAEAIAGVGNALNTLLLVLPLVLFVFNNFKGLLYGLATGGFVLATSWVVQFAGGLATTGIVYGRFTGAVAYATVALGEFTAALALSTGAVLGIAAAIGVVVYALFRWKTAEEDLAAIRNKKKAQRYAELQHLTDLRQSTDAMVLSLIDRAVKEKTLSEELKIQLRQLSVLNRKQIETGLAAGTLFETSENAVMSLAAAFEMQKQGMTGADRYLRDAEKHRRGSLKSAADLKAENATLVQQYDAIIKKHEGTALAQAAVRKEASTLFGEEVNSTEDVIRVYDKREEKVEELIGGANRLYEALKMGKIAHGLSLHSKLISNITGKTAKQAKEEKNLANAILKRLEFELKLMREIENLRTRGATTRKNDLAASIEAAEKLYAAEIAAALEMGLEIAAIESDLVETISNLKLRSRLETINKLKDIEEDAIKKTRSMREMTQAEELHSEYLTAEANLDRIYQLEVDANNWSWELAKTFEDAKLALQREAIAKAEEIRRNDEKKRLADIERITTEISTRDLKESERLASEKAQILSQLKRDEVGKREVIESDYDYRIRQARKEERRNIIEFINWRIRRGREGVKRMLNAAKGKVAPFIIALFGRDKESDKYMKRQAGKAWKEALKLQRKMDRQATINERRKSKGKPEKEFGRLKESAKEAAQGIAQIMGATLGAVGAGAVKAVGMMKSIAGAFSSVVSKFSGFSFSPAAMAQELAAAKAAADEEGAGFSYAKEARKYVDGLVDQAIGFADGLAKGLGPALEQIAERLPDLLDAIIAAIPKVVQAIVDVLPGLIMTIINKLPELFSALVNGLVDVALALFDALPEMLTQFLSVALPDMITTLLAAIPKIIDGFVKALPDILTAIIDSIPIIIEAIIMGLPDIVISIIKAIPIIVIELIKAIPRLIVAIVWGILKALGAVVGELGKIIAEAFVGVFNFFKDWMGSLKETFKGDPEKSKSHKIWTTIGDIFTLGGVSRWKKNKAEAYEELGREMPTGGNAYSGINYVPANMRVNVHKGEAIIPASRNAQGDKGGMNRAAPASYGGGPGGGGMGQPIDIAIMAEGRLLDAVQITAMRRGHAPEIKSELRRASGVTVGFNRGSFDYWTK